MVAVFRASSLEVKAVDGPYIRIVVAVDLLSISIRDPHFPQLQHLVT